MSVGELGTRRRLRLPALVNRFVMSFGLIIVAVVLWQVWTAAAGDVYFPTPARIASEFGALFFSPDPAALFLGAAVYSDVIPSLGRIFAGFFIGSAIGIVIGAAIGMKRVVGDYVNPIVEFLRSIPATATLPLFFVLLGVQDTMRIGFIAFGCTWYVLINTANGVATVERGYVEMAHSFRISRLRTIVQIVLPAASPKVFAGVRVSLTAALLLSVVSEFFFATSGIGYQLITSQMYFRFAQMWAWMVLLALLGLLFNTVLDVLERRALAWHRNSHGG